VVRAFADSNFFPFPFEFRRGTTFVFPLPPYLICLLSHQQREKTGKFRHPTMGCAPSSRAAQTEFAGPDAAPSPFLGQHPPNRTATTSALPSSQGDDIACETSQSSVSTVPAHARPRHTDYGSWILAPTSNAAEADGDESVETPGSSVASPLGLNNALHQAAAGFTSPRPSTTFPAPCPGDDHQSTLSSTASIVAAQGYVPHQLTALARLNRVFPTSAARMRAKE
jgi:hypothetical protein